MRYRWNTRAKCWNCLLFLFVLGWLSSGQAVEAQVSYQVTSSPVPIIQTGEAEVLGEVKLTKLSSPPGVPQITSASTLSFAYQGVTISNAFSGSLAVDAATGTIADSEGLTIKFTGGFVDSRVTATVSGATVSLNFPAGLTIVDGDYISINGVRAVLQGGSAGSVVSTQMLSSPTGTHVPDITDPTVATAYAGLNVSATAVILGACDPPSRPVLTVTEGFSKTFVQYVAVNMQTPLNLRPGFGANANTQVRIQIAGLPSGVSLDWPDSVPAIAGPGRLVILSESSAVAVYQYTTTDQTISDALVESFDVRPQPSLAAGASLGQATAQIQLYPAQGSGSVPRFNHPLQPAAGLIFVTVASCNPVPNLTGISPNANSVNGAPLTLIATGSGFVSGSVVRWNLSPRPTYYDPVSGELRADIPASDFASVAPVTVSVLNPVPGGGPSNSLPFTVYSNNPVPTVNSLSPGSVTRFGPGFVLTVNGNNFVTGSKVRWNGSDRNTTFVDNNILRADILDTDLTVAGTANISVFNPTPGGGASGDTPITINNSNLVPSISSLSPPSITAGSQAFQLTVRGANFVNGTMVRWNGFDRTTSFVSDTEVRASILATDITAVAQASVTVFTPPPGGGTSNALNFNVDNPLPSITGLAPASAMVGSAAVILTVTGVNFVNGSKVRWNAADLVTTFVSATQLKATIPSTSLLTAGSASITVVNVPTGGGTSSAESFTINNPVPTITSLSPTSVTAGNTAFTMTIMGVRFLAGSKVRWNGILRDITYVSSSQIKLDISAEDITSPGTVAIIVNNPEPGGGDSNPLNLTVTNPVPVIASLSPSSAGVGTSGLTITVTGSKFVGSSKVRWNNSDRVTTFVNSNQLKVALTTADLAKAGTFNITVFNGTPGGGTSDMLPFSVNLGQPTITSLSPSSATAGTASVALTVNGSNFVTVSVIRWNGSDLTTKFVSNIKLTATLNAANLPQAGTVSVTVFNPAPGGGTSSPVSFTITAANPVPTITSFDPVTLPAGGSNQVLTVTGTNFVSDSKVRWNGADRSTEFVSATALKVSVQDSDISKTGTANITVFNPAPGGGLSIAKAITIANPLPEITNLEPASALVRSANVVLTVNGKNFVQTSKVRWNGVDLATKFVNVLQMTSTIPAASLTQEGIANITVYTPSPGGGTSVPKPFTIAHSNPVPAITSLTPASIRAGGEAFTLTVNGSNFVSNSKIRWSGSDRTTVYVSDTQLRATIPDTDIVQTGAVNVTIFNPEPGGGTSPAKAMTILNALPVISSLSPAAAVVGGPELTLTVNGKNFTSTAKVRWNGVDRVTKYVSNSQLTATVPASDLSKVGTYSITVVNVVTDGPSTPVSFVVGNLVLDRLAFTPTSAKGGSTITGKVSLNAPAPSGGVIVSLSSSSPVTASVPSIVAVPSASLFATFPVTAKSVSTTTTVYISASYGGITRRMALVVGDSSISDSSPESTQFVPIVLSTTGANNSFYTSSLTLTNRSATTAILDFCYKASIGEGSGSASDFLLPGEQRVAANAITYLKGLGIPIPDAGNRGGTLSIRFWGMPLEAEVSATARTTTAVPNGRAGLSYPAINSATALNKPAYIFGLRQNSSDRSNLALQNAGTESDGDIVLSITVYPGNPTDTYSVMLPDQVLSPGGFKQLNSILAMDGVGFDSGYVRVERISGTAPFFAYGIINDQATSDGSFIPPLLESELVGPRGLTIPAVVETPVFSSELVLANSSGTTRRLRCTYVADAITSQDHSLSFYVELKPGQQLIYPEVVQMLRQMGSTVIPAGSGIVGGLYITDPNRDVSGIIAGCRTSSAGGGGQYGLFYTGVPFGKAAREIAWIYGLQQNLENRSNLAIVNTGETDSSTDSFQLDLYNGETGKRVQTIGGINVGARRFSQISMILDRFAPGVRQGYVRVRKISGNNPFVAYGVINDGGEPGARTGDGTYVSMSVER